MSEASAVEVTCEGRSVGHAEARLRRITVSSSGVLVVCRVVVLVL